MVFWRWWIFTGLLAFSGGYCLYENLHQWLWNNDVTKLSFVILISFIFISLYCGQLSYLKYEVIIIEVNTFAWLLHSLFLCYV